MNRPERREWVDSTAALGSLGRWLRRAKRIGIDTEFVGERTYVPRLELLQLATDEGTAVVDCQAVQRLDPVLELVLDSGVEKVVHAGQQDLELLCRLSGAVPAPIFDTQVAAAMVGYGAQPGYAALVERLLHTRVEKAETLTDWSRRPLDEGQVAYAHEDVRYLLPLRDCLGARLRELGREKWLREELQRLEDQRTYARPAVEEAYVRVRGRGTLRPRNLAVLRELAAWREEEAQRRNKPRGSILSDDLLVELGRRAPERPEALRNFRGQFARVVARHAAPIAAAVRRALALPQEEWPRSASPPRSGTIEPGVVEVLQGALRMFAVRAHVAPSLVATSADLHALVEAHLTGAEAKLPLLRGWRYEVAGRHLLRLLRGEARLRIDPRRLRVRLDGGAD